jgi:hypothetical protein
MRFIDMMASDIWSSADIDNKVRSLIRSRYSSDDELKASRLARKTNPSEVELEFVAGVDEWIANCLQYGADASADMDLLAKVIDYEQRSFIAKKAHEEALAWNESLLQPTEEVEEEEEILEPEVLLEPLEVPELLALPVPEDEIYELWLARNPQPEEPTTVA